MNTSSKLCPPNQASTTRSFDTIAAARYAVDAIKTEVGDALDPGQAAVAGDTASEMAGMATQQANTFASELEAMQNATLSAR